MDISVITPFYKGNAYMEGLFACVARCAARAPELQVELILVNDSPDVPVEYREEWVRGFSLEILRNEVNVGIHRSRVNGLNKARGEFIQFLDQDDILEEDALRSQYSLTENADVVVANGYDESPGNRGLIYRSNAHHQQALYPDMYYGVGNQIVSPGQCLIRKAGIPAQWCRSTISRNGSDDLLLWLMMFSCGARFRANPDRLYRHVDTGENVSSNVGKMLASSWEVLEILREENGIGITGRQEKQFRRSRTMAGHYVGKSKPRKLLAMLLFPDVAIRRLKLRELKKAKP